MEKTISTNVVQRESEWRDHLARFASSGKTIAAFCRSESLSEGNFYTWRKRLQINGRDVALTPPAPACAAFIDLGVVNGAIASESVPRAETTHKAASPGIEVRIDLGGGIVLTLRRH